MTSPVQMVPINATHHISMDACKAWLAEYGLDISTVATAVVRFEYDTAVILGWLDVEWYKGKNPEGYRYGVFWPTAEDDPAWNGLDAGRGRSTIPLHSWPPLTLTPPRDAG